MDKKDIENMILKDACNEQDQLNTRRFKVAKLLEPINYKQEEDRTQAIESFVKSNMPYNEITNYVKQILSAGFVRTDRDHDEIPGVY